MAEEHEWHEASNHNHVLCANNCGFFGSPTTLNLCSKCYKDHRLKENQISTAKLAVEKSLAPPVTFSSSSSASDTIATDLGSGELASSQATAEVEVELVPKPLQQRNRCGSCSRRVGLTGFACRCGMTFCGAHRHPELHGCVFDFKAVGKEAIAKANPVVKGVKLDKI